MSCIHCLFFSYKVLFIKTFGQCRLCVCLCFEDILKYNIYQSTIIRDIAEAENLGSRVAVLPGKSLRFQKVFARLTEKKTVKSFQYFQNDLEFSK